MNEIDALELLRASLWSVVVGAGPAVTAAMIVGIVIALFQALTQIQETTLTFVPKIIVIFISLVLTAPLIAAQIFSFTEQAYSHIATGF